MFGTSLSISSMMKAASLCLNGAASHCMNGHTSGKVYLLLISLRVIQVDVDTGNEDFKQVVSKVSEADAHSTLADEVFLMVPKQNGH